MSAVFSQPDMKQKTLTGTGRRRHLVGKRLSWWGEDTQQMLLVPHRVIRISQSLTYRCVNTYAERGGPDGVLMG